MTDKLLLRARDGDKLAEKEIFDRLTVRFKAIAKQRIRDRQDADDVAQEASLTVFQKYKSEEFTTSFEAWAYGVLRMKIGNYLQSARSRRRHIAAAVEVEESTACAERPSNPLLRRELLDCVRELIVGFPRYERVLNLIHQGFKTDEVSRNLRISPK